MIFPVQKRVHFARNPLKEVSIQINFHEAIDLPTESVIQLKDSLKHEFPWTEKKEAQEVNIQADTGAVERKTSPVYEFYDVNRENILFVGSSAIGLRTRSYENWGNFFSKFLLLFDAPLIRECTDSISRIGLRYQDVIERSTLEIDPETPWGELLNPSLTGLFDCGVIARNLTANMTQTVINLGNKDEFVKLQTGIVENNKTKESCFIIDSDFSASGRFAHDRSAEFLSRFNTEARNLFRWSISDRLFELLQPVDYE
jgi:uncharacterized protein (TIGR04255 family)